MWNAISSYSQDEKESCSIFTICFGPVPGVLSIRCRCPSELKKIWPARRGKASSLKATCGLSRRRAVSKLVVLGAVALFMPAQAAMLSLILPVFRYRKLDSQPVWLADVVDGEGPEARDGDLVQFNYVCIRANGYFVHSTVDQFSGESKPVTLPLGGEEMIRGLKDVIIGMKAGGKRTALIPPEVGYIRETLKPIPEEFGPRRSLLSHAKEPLVFEVQLLKVL
ncbi:peptidyl-prolyl cis-trans isomerase FKBP16-1, chloroplastic-like [Miscanthus floridulus]|uniref:peptidyl-prolyl cis-trans isomerase FKBP16-1, chloroplastic-like n=1 Tax=Miscanthus floridulus TaxID=154761 RepID=UPI003458489A